MWAGRGREGCQVEGNVPGGALSGDAPLSSTKKEEEEPSDQSLSLADEPPLYPEDLALLAFNNEADEPNNEKDQAIGHKNNPGSFEEILPKGKQIGTESCSQLKKKAKADRSHRQEQTTYEQQRYYT